jgi:hypothetical protein
MGAIDWELAALHWQPHHIPNPNTNQPWTGYDVDRGSGSLARDIDIRGARS